MEIHFHFELLSIEVVQILKYIFIQGILIHLHVPYAHVEFIAVVSNDYDFFGQENIQFTFPLRYFKLIL